MAIGYYFINVIGDYQWLFVPIYLSLLIFLNNYSMKSYWWEFYYWSSIIILLMVIRGYSISDYSIK
jgi:hypothetical protein